MNSKKENRCLILNTSSPNQKIVKKYIKNNYKIFCVNNNSIIFCLKNNIKFSYFEDLLNFKHRLYFLNEIKKIWSELLLSKQKKNEIYSILKRDYYALSYFFLSCIQGVYISKHTYFRNLNKVTYYGENFKNIEFFSYYSTKLNLVLISTLFSNLSVKPKLIFTKKLYDIKKNKYTLATKLISVLNNLICKIKLILTKSNTFVFLQSGEIYRFKFLSKKYPVFSLKTNNHDSRNKIKFLFNKNIIYSNFYLKNKITLNINDQINFAYNQFLDNSRNKKFLFLKKFKLYFYNYFNFRLKNLAESKFELQRIFLNKNIDNIIISNLWDFESYLPIMVFNRIKKVFLLPHSILYPTDLYKHYPKNSYFLYSKEIEKKIQPKNLKFKKLKMQFIKDEYPVTKNKKIKINNKTKKNFLFLSQDFPPAIDTISIFNKKSSFYKKLNWLNSTQDKNEDKIRLFVKLHPSINNSSFIENLEKLFSNLIFIKEQISYEDLKKNFNTFILSTFPVKIGISLLLDKKKIYFFDLDGDSKLLSNKINFNKIFKSKNIYQFKNKKDLIKIFKF